MSCYYIQYSRNNAITWIFSQANSKDAVFFAILFKQGRAEEMNPYKSKEVFG